jgi:McrBC 5-methylcytosine restriction system component
VEDLQAALGARAGLTTRDAQTIRYSPMTENYRPAVDLSLSILARRPRIASAGGEGKAFGVLLDMAEIWELYVAKLLQVSLPGLRVNHTGRAKRHIQSLLVADGDELGSCLEMKGSISRALHRLFWYTAINQSYDRRDSSHCVSERRGLLSYVAG